MTVSAEIIFVRLLSPLLLGISFFYSFTERFHLHLCALMTFLVIAALLGINFFYKSLAAYKFKPIIGILITSLFFFFGGWISLGNKDTLRPNYFGNFTYRYLKVRIHDEPQGGQGIVRFTANVTACYDSRLAPKRAHGNILLSIKTDSTSKANYAYGDELIIAVQGTSILPPFNPGEFDFKAWLALKNVYQQAFVSQKLVVKTGINKGNAILKYALTLRKNQINIYDKIIADKEAFAVASTLILGYRADLSSEILSSYSKTGTIHALSVSGMHVGIIYIVLNWLLRFLDRSKGSRIFKVLLICSSIWFYSLLTGFSPSILRSAIMLTVYILAKSFAKHTNGYNILAFTAFCMLLYNPFLVWDVGFQLSFLAVLGLIYLHPKIYRWLYFKQRWADWLWSSIALSVAAQLATFPLSIYYFHQFPLYFIFSNLFILIPITLLMYLGLSILLFKLYFLAPLFEWLIIFMNNGLKWIANLPCSGINQIWIDKVQLSLLTVALLLGVIALENHKKRLLLLSLTVLFTFQLSMGFQKIESNKQRKIILFSLQKGYAAAFVNARHAIFLSNIKNTDKNFQFYVKPA
ncbi:MAG: ComEC family competence protein, partial [Chitinophagaceae bacterium]